MRRRTVTAVLGAVLLVLLLAAVAAVVGLGGRDGAGDDGAAGPAPAATTPAPPATTPDGSPVTDLVVLGDSLAAGYQPTLPGDRTDPDGGYAGVLRDALGEAAGEPPALTNLACPGETVGTFLAGGTCDYPAGSQAAAADAALRALPDGGAGALVTVQLGANDVQRCARLDVGGPTGPSAEVDEACAAAGLDAVRQGLAEVLAGVRDAAPQARVVVLDYYNPYAVAALLGPGLAEFATRADEVHTALNELVADVARDAGAVVAPVGAAFTAGDDGEPPVGPICSLTWMCADPPDIHATDAGYRVMAEQVLAVR